MNQGVSRRSFVSSAAVGLALGSIGISTAGAVRVAYADETASEEISVDYDVIVVGSGLSGMTCAITLKQAGVNVVVVEKRDENGYGGNSKISGGYIIVPPTDDEEGRGLFVEDLLDMSQGQADEDILNAIAENVQGAVDWLNELGITTYDPVASPLYDVLFTMVIDGIGTAMNTLQTIFTDLGGEILFENKLLDLVMADTGRICGVKVRTADGIRTITAENVVLACGGYAANKWLLEVLAGADADQMVVRGRSWLTGDGMLAAWRAGAGMIQIGGVEGVHVCPVTAEYPSSTAQNTLVPYCIAINAEGKRFVDETVDYVGVGKAMLEETGVTAALVVDAELVATESNVEEAISGYESLGIDVKVADTIEELAELIEVDPDVFVATIEEWNEHVNDDGTATGMDVNKSSLAYKIETPPYYALYPMVPGVTQCFGGLYVNSQFQVCETDGEVIGGLYAVGEIIGGNTYDNYIGGTSIATCLASGRLVGTELSS